MNNNHFAIPMVREHDYRRLVSSFTTDNQILIFDHMFTNIPQVINSCILEKYFQTTKQYWLHTIKIGFQLFETSQKNS